MVDLVRAARDELVRVGLLGAVDVRGVVPELIVRSWRRSIGSSVKSAVVCEQFHEVDTDSRLGRAAEPVLERWQHQLSDTGITLFLSDRAGSIVARRTTDFGVQRRLDRVHAAEGFNYSEDSVGTNGLGTAMVERRPVWIEGSQHYNEALGDLACAAAPVAAPSGSVIGAISVGGPLDRASPLMLSLTREIGSQIEERLRQDARPQDLALAMSFMRFTNSQRPTVVMDRESILANTPGLSYVSVSSHVILWELLNAQQWARQTLARFMLEGTGVEVSARRVVDGPHTHYVLHFSQQELAWPAGHLDADVATGPAASGPHGAPVMVVEGPPGSGRATRARELREPTRGDAELETVTIDRSAPVPWGSVEALLHGGVDVLLCRLERIDEPGAEELRQVVLQHRAAALAGTRVSRLSMTVSRDQASPGLRRLVEEAGVGERTRALKDTRDRIPGLVKHVIDQVDPHGRHTFSPAALQAFVEWDWPGNISELVATVTTLIESAPLSVVERRHLPKHLQQAPPRRQMSLLESAERGAIIQAMDAAGGNKSEAAKLLGVGRTTLYRRLKQLGLDDGEDLR
jgi:hypothetical protein